MITLSTIKHLRIPFSLFLLPVFLFALANAQPVKVFNGVIAFIVWHIFIYPASNGYNSYFDKDEGSIGGMKNPPKVTKDLYWTSLLFDVIGVLLAWTINFWFALMVFICGMVSKAYSHPSVRLKKYPVISWLTVGVFQGGLTYLISTSALFDRGLEIWSQSSIYFPAIVATFLLLGSYPMTQIYQHEEDSQRGDHTISLKVGIRGTFYLTATMFSIAMLGFFLYFQKYQQSLTSFYILLASLSPVFAYFTYWFSLIYKDETQANFEHTMRFNAISSICFIGYFSYLAFVA